MIYNYTVTTNMVESTSAFDLKRKLL